MGGSQLRGGSVKVGAVNTCSPRVRPLAAHFHVIGRRLSLLVHAFSPPLAAHAPRFSIAGPYRRALCRRGLGSASRAEAVHLGPGRRRWRVRYNRCARSSIGCAGKEPWRHQGSEPSWCTRSGLREERRGGKAQDAEDTRTDIYALVGTIAHFVVMRACLPGSLKRPRRSCPHDTQKRGPDGQSGLQLRLSMVSTACSPRSRRPYAPADLRGPKSASFSPMRCRPLRFVRTSSCRASASSRRRMKSAGSGGW